MEQGQPLVFALWRLRHPAHGLELTLMAQDTPSGVTRFRLLLNGAVLRYPDSDRAVFTGRVTLTFCISIGVHFMRQGWVDLDMEN